MDFSAVVDDLGTARAVRRLVEAWLVDHRVTGFREPPEEPTTCCGRGCNGCVWEGFYAAMGWWRDDALELMAKGSPEHPPC